MTNVYLRSNYSIKTISKFFLLSLLPLIAAGFYKNGIKLYANDLVGIYGLLKPLIITVTGFIIGVIINLLYETIFRKSSDTFINKIFSSFHPVYGVILASIISINTNLLLFIGITFLVFMISKFIKESRVNIMALTALLIILIINLTSDFTFLNTYESTKTLSLTGMDYLIGLGSGGINTSFVLLLLISLVILAQSDYYKKSIPLFSGITFFICMMFYCIYKNQVGLILDNIFSNGILFSFIYLATDPLSSSYTRKGKCIYGIIIGLLTFVLFLIEPSLAVIGAILMSSILHDFIDKICLR